MDRIDIRLNLAPPGGALWAASQPPDSSATVRTRVDSARSRAAYRAAALGLVVPLTSAYPSAMLRDQLAPAPEAAHLLHSALTAGRISARGADRAIRVAWTLADLSGSSRPGLHEVGHALALRSGALAEAAA